MLLAYFTLGVCLAVASGGFVAVWLYGTPPPPSPLVAHAPCTQQVAGPRERWLCSDGRAYDREDGRWTDAGPLAPLPWTPAR